MLCISLPFRFFWRTHTLFLKVDVKGCGCLSVEVWGLVNMVTLKDGASHATGKSAPSPIRLILLCGCTCQCGDVILTQYQQGVVLTFSIQSSFSMDVSCDCMKVICPIHSPIPLFPLCSLISPTHVLVSLLTVSGCGPILILNGLLRY